MSGDYRVFVPQPIHEEAMDLLREHATVIPGFGPKSREINVVLPEIHAILIRTAPLTAEMIEQASSLRVIARHGVGVDNISVGAATRRGIPILITPMANLRSVAEHVFALALAVKRNLVSANSKVRGGGFAERDGLVGGELFGSSLGVIGLGRVGEEVVRIAAGGFGMKVLGYDPQLLPNQIRVKGAEPVKSLAELLPVCDLVTVHVPLTPDTRGLIGSRELSSMRAGSILIQTSRGGVVDEDALVDALRGGDLAGAGIDVFKDEPPRSDHPLFSMPEVILTPHIAAHTRQAMKRMAMDAARGILDILHGAEPSGPSGKAAWKIINPDCVFHPSDKKGRGLCL